MPKKSLRRQMLARRRSLTHDEWQAASQMAQQNLMQLEFFQQASCVALYAPIHNEIDTALLLEAALKTGKRVLYPAVCGTDLVFRQVEGMTCLSEGCFGILEPCSADLDHQADAADLIVVPGVAFDTNGHRIGYGKGFYDRFLRHPGRRALLVGLCHDFQLIGTPLPSDPHDIRMDLVISDQHVHRID